MEHARLSSRMQTTGLKDYRRAGSLEQLYFGPVRGTVIKPTQLPPFFWHLRDSRDSAVSHSAHGAL